MEQIYESANTSINSKKLPAIYNKINWGLVQILSPHVFFKVLDYGCGRYQNHLKEFINSKGGIFYGYDPFWNPDFENDDALNCHPDIVICSNVLNVIKEDKIVMDINKKIRSFGVPYFIKIYEGDKSNIGRETKKGCWQRNQETSQYLFHQSENCKNQIIYKEDFSDFLK